MDSFGQENISAREDAYSDSLMRARHSDRENLEGQERRAAESGNKEEKKISHGDALAQARNSDKIKNLAKARAAMNPKEQMKMALSIGKEINLIKDIPYFAAIIFAILKDVLDYAGIGSLPGIGTVVTLCVTILIVFMNLISGGFKGSRMIKKSLVLGTGTVVEMFGLGINFLPIETLAAGGTYLVELQSRAIEKNGQ